MCDNAVALALIVLIHLTNNLVNLNSVSYPICSGVIPSLLAMIIPCVYTAGNEDAFSPRYDAARQKNRGIQTCNH
jgi:hypothetical protein